MDEDLRKLERVKQRAGIRLYELADGTGYEFGVFALVEGPDVDGAQLRSWWREFKDQYATWQEIQVSGLWPGAIPKLKQRHDAFVDWLEEHHGFRRVERTHVYLGS